MKALLSDGTLRLVEDYPAPVPAAGEALIRVLLAGICATDLEVQQGYKGFHGVLGHEFVGQVVEADAPGWTGRRVVGEINIGCGRCEMCRQALPSHCASRAALGILGRDGAFAELIALPLANLHRVPDGMPDEVAVFTEPLAAALQVMSLVQVRPEDRVGVVGDGKLGLLVAQALATSGASVTVIGRHAEKLALAAGWGLHTDAPAGLLDVVVDCSGHPDGVTAALALVRPRGTLVLKSTYPSQPRVDLTRVVVHEIQLVGSRCGPFRPALELLQSGRVRVQPLIEAIYSLQDGLTAMEHAGRRGALKILIKP